MSKSKSQLPTPLSVHVSDVRWEQRCALSSEQDRRPQRGTEGAQGHRLGLPRTHSQPSSAMIEQSRRCCFSPGKSRLAPTGQEGPTPCHHTVPCVSPRWQAWLLRGHTEWTKDLRGGVGLQSHWLRPPQRPDMLHTEGPKNQKPLPGPDVGRAGSPCTSHL